MWKHIEEKHNDLADNVTHSSAYDVFAMNVHHLDKDPMRRIVREAVRERRILDHEDELMYSFTSNDTVPNRVKMKVKPFLMNTREEFHLTKLVGVSLSQQ